MFRITTYELGGDAKLRARQAIVKLFLKYEGQPATAKWPIATGWLIRPDLLVTAGHCAFDWGHNREYFYVARSQ